MTGTDPLENPSSVITNYGFLNDGATLTDGTKTEADQNLYLTFPNSLGGPAAGYDYGQHFVFQGHENSGDLAYVTRVNLDVTDPAHRITLLTPVGQDGKTHFNAIDGSAWDPFTHSLLFTQENGSAGGTVEVTPDGSLVRTLYGQLGQGGFEGIRVTPKGDIWIAEDAGGTSVDVDPSDPSSPKVARQPNSFIFRFTPADPTDLSAGGKLQALQVIVGGKPLVFHASDPVGDVFSVQNLALRNPGSNWPVRWVTVHDTATDGTAPFSANALAKVAGATPFKRPENGLFQPGSDFRTYYFDETGDTNSDSGNVPALAARGAWGSILRVHLNPAGTVGRISIAVTGDAAHNSWDNLTFAAPNLLLAAEDRGDGLHAQLNTRDSVWAYRVGDPNAERFIALGRDTEAEATVVATGDGDNEPTGLIVSNGDSSVSGLYGTSSNLVDARAFVTQQHGFNTLWEITRDFGAFGG